MRLARKHVSWYSRGLAGSAEFRAAMNRLANAEAVLALIDRFYDPLIGRGPGHGSGDSLRALGLRTASTPQRHGGCDMSTVVARASRLLAGGHRSADTAAILGALPVPVILLDPENRFRHVNNAAEQFLGVSAAGLAHIAP